MAGPTIRDRLMARVYDRVLAPLEQAGLQRWRAELLGDLSGRVAEIGAGTGANLAHYPASVTRLTLLEPVGPMADRLADRARRDLTDALEVSVVEAGGEELTQVTRDLDAVVSTLVLCTVPDPAATLAQIHDALKPGGRLVFLEHVAADRPERLRRQRRLDKVWPHVAGGCRLTRDTEAAIVAAGFEIDDITRESARKAPTFIRAMIRGTAVKPITP